MTKPTHRRSRALRWLLIGMVGWFTACGQTNGLEKQEQKMTAKKMTLWQTIDYLGSHLPLRREKVEQFFNLTLSKLESSNPYVTFWNGDGVFLQNDVRISRIVLGVRNDNEQDPGMLTLNVSGTCLKLDEVKNRYGKITIAGAPSGHSKNEETTYETKLEWGSLIFGFAERDPDCLSSVGFSPRKR